MNIIDLLEGQLTPQLIGQLSNQIGGANPQQTTTAAQGIMSTLIGMLSKNASTPEGAKSLDAALERDHDGSLLDNIASLIGNQTQQASKATDGQGILNHLLGERQGNTSDMISQMSGLNTNQASSLMTTLAPIVMAMLGKQKRQQGLNFEGLSSLLNNTVNQKKQSNPAMDLITSFLDKDNDGSIIDDITGMLGNFLNKK